MTNRQATHHITNNYLGVIDSTLREGEQHAAFDGFTLDQARQILSLLARLGVERAELPNPLAVGMADYVKQLVAHPERPRLVVHIRNHHRDIEAALLSGVEAVSILTTVDSKRLEAMGQTLTSYLKQLKKVVRWAKSAGLETRVSVEHSWSHPVSIARSVYATAIEEGVDRIGIADTLGHATHWEVAEKLQELKLIFPDTSIEVHFHNDYQAATTNALEALAHGANWVNTSLGGYGERTGITPLSAFLARLGSLDENLRRRYRLALLTSAERLVAQIVGTPLAHNLLTADNAFSHKAGIHLNGILRHGPNLYEPVPPAVVGNQRRLVTGSRVSGKTSQEQLVAVCDRHDLQNNT